MLKRVNQVCPPNSSKRRLHFSAAFWRSLWNMTDLVSALWHIQPRNVDFRRYCPRQTEYQWIPAVLDDGADVVFCSQIPDIVLLCCHLKQHLLSWSKQAKITIFELKMKCKHENKWEHFLIRTPLSAVLFYTRIWDENIFKKKITEYSKKKKKILKKYSIWATVARWNSKTQC